MMIIPDGIKSLLKYFVGLMNLDRHTLTGSVLSLAHRLAQPPSAGRKGRGEGRARRAPPTEAGGPAAPDYVRRDMLALGVSVSCWGVVVVQERDKRAIKRNLVISSLRHFCLFYT